MWSLALAAHFTAAATGLAIPTHRRVEMARSRFWQLVGGMGAPGIVRSSMGSTCCFFKEKEMVSKVEQPFVM